MIFSVFFTLTRVIYSNRCKISWIWNLECLLLINSVPFFHSTVYGEIFSSPMKRFKYMYLIVSLSILLFYVHVQYYIASIFRTGMNDNSEIRDNSKSQIEWDIFEGISSIDGHLDLRPPGLRKSEVRGFAGGRRSGVPEVGGLRFFRKPEVGGPEKYAQYRIFTPK